MLNSLTSSVELESQPIIWCFGFRCNNNVCLETFHILVCFQCLATEATLTSLKFSSRVERWGVVTTDQAEGGDLFCTESDHPRLRNEASSPQMWALRSSCRALHLHKSRKPAGGGASSHICLYTECIKAAGLHWFHYWHISVWIG